MKPVYVKVKDDLNKMLKDLHVLLRTEEIIMFENCEKDFAENFEAHQAIFDLVYKLQDTINFIEYLELDVKEGKLVKNNSGKFEAIYEGRYKNEVIKYNDILEAFDMENGFWNICKVEMNEEGNLYLKRIEVEEVGKYYSELDNECQTFLIEEGLWVRKRVKKRRKI